LNKLVFTVLLCCFSALANAQQLPSTFNEFVKSSDPNTLEYFNVSETEECPWTFADAVGVIEGVINRSRINTYGARFSKDPWLKVAYRCIKLGSERGWAVNFDVKFGRDKYLFDKDYGNILIGSMDSNQFYLDNLKRYVENAVTDFVKVNFLSNSN
jgi:hypothetical protein